MAKSQLNFSRINFNTGSLTAIYIVTISICKVISFKENFQLVILSILINISEKINTH